MSINIDKAFETDQDGYSITDDDGNVLYYLASGSGDPSGSPAPVNTFYFDQATQLIWYKFGALDTDWRQLRADDLTFDPSTSDLVATNLQLAIKELADRHFGKDAGFVQNLGSIVSTSASFVTFLSLPFTVSPATGGTYRFGWSAISVTSKSNTVGTIRLVVDPGLPGEIVIGEGTMLNVQRAFVGFDAGVLTAGAHTVDIQGRRDAGNGSFTISKMRIEEWRVS